MATSSSFDSPAGNSIPNSPSHDLPQEPLRPTFIDPDKNKEVDGKKPAPATTQRQKKRAKEVSERPSWLPEDWTVVLKVREKGVTAGTTDRYYYPPDRTGCCRSKKEVENYINTGIKRKTSKTSADPCESRPSDKKKRSKSGSKSGCSMPPTPVNFDFENLPVSTTWVLNSGSEDLWDTYIDDNMVLKTAKKEWHAAFQEIASGSTDR